MYEQNNTTRRDTDDFFEENALRTFSEIHKRFKRKANRPPESHVNEVNISNFFNILQVVFKIY